MVVAVMLANGRQAMVRRAIASFCAQTYPADRRRLVVWNTGEHQAIDYNLVPDAEIHFPNVAIDQFVGASIGMLRNAANKYAVSHYAESCTRADIICHWDSDDWSHPRRIAEQVHLLELSGKECVGYRDMIFWKTRCRIPECPSGLPRCVPANEAWWFASKDARYLLGSSMMYQVGAWVRYPFNERCAKYEDQDWWAHNNSRCAGYSSLVCGDGTFQEEQLPVSDVFGPRMICSIHDDNSSEAYQPNKMRPPTWRRVPEWDAYCADRMKL